MAEHESENEGGSNPVPGPRALESGPDKSAAGRLKRDSTEARPTRFGYLLIFFGLMFIATAVAFVAGSLPNWRTLNIFGVALLLLFSVAIPLLMIVAGLKLVRRQPSSSGPQSPSPAGDRAELSENATPIIDNRRTRKSSGGHFADRPFDSPILRRRPRTEPASSGKSRPVRERPS